MLEVSRISEFGNQAKFSPSDIALNEDGRKEGNYKPDLNLLLQMGRIIVRNRKKFKKDLNL